MILCIDVGGTKSAVGLVGRDGQVLARRQRPAGVERGPAAMIEDYVEMAGEVAAEAGLAISELSDVGVACGGPLDPMAGVLYSPLHLPRWDGLPLAAILEGKLGLPVWIDNDANGAALAEYWLGAGRVGSGSGNGRYDPLVYMTISTGIGGGIVIGGELYHGATGNGGELGHLVVQAGGRPCKCGGRGCLEAYCSGTNIAVRAQEALSECPASALGKLGHPLRAEDVVALAQQGDDLAREVWNETLDLLAAGVVSVVNAFEPAIVVLGGGVTRAGEALFVPLRERVHASAMRRPRPGAKIVPAELGDDVGILGAAAIALSRGAVAERPW